MSKLHPGNLIRYSLAVLFFVWSFPAVCQKQLKGVIADSNSHKILPFATIKPIGQPRVFITGINGQFSFSVPENTLQFAVSYISYTSKTVDLIVFKYNDT